MQILIKTNKGLKPLGEGTIYSKSQIRLNEFIDANIGSANGIQQAQMKAKKLMNQNPGVESASADAGHLDGQSDKNSGEGLKMEVPVDATGTQLAQAQRAIKDQSADDMQITFTKPQNQTDSNMSESKITEMRRNSIPFTKEEMTKFLASL